jgi:hypothetical protein
VAWEGIISGSPDAIPPWYPLVTGPSFLKKRTVAPKTRIFRQNHESLRLQFTALGGRDKATDGEKDNEEIYVGLRWVDSFAGHGRARLGR